MSGGSKAIPKPNELDLEFYRRTVSGEALHVQRCDDCHTHSHPPRYYCPNCFSGSFSFVPVNGRGFVYSYTVSHFSVEPAWQAEVPYITAVVEIDEGPRFVCAARGITRDSVQIGQRVRIVPERRTDEYAFLWAEPDDG